MFCKNCGSQISDGDRFCGTCGQQQSEGMGNSGGFTQVRISDTGLIKLFKNYFIKPVSFFNELKGEDLLKTSVALLLGMPIIAGLLNILYSSALINSIFSIIKKLPSILAEAKIITEQEALQVSQEFMISSKILDAKSRIGALIDNKDVFLNGAGQVLVIIVLTAVLLAVLNALILKNRIKPADILFISTSSYIPLVLSMVLAIIATFISITFGLLILISGYILSFIALYSGIRQFSDEKNDKIFILMTILFILISAILAICIVTKIESSLVTLKSIMDNLEHL